MLFIFMAYLKQHDELHDLFKTFTNRKQNIVKTWNFLQRIVTLVCILHTMLKTDL